MRVLSYNGWMPIGISHRESIDMSTASMESQTMNARSIHLSFASADEVHDGLDNAVETLIQTAAQDGTCGIRVTRHEPGAYTVALDESVPFGETVEDIAA